MFKLTEKTALVLAQLLVFLMIGLAILGGIKTYSPIPHWDMWDGTVGFILKTMDGDVSAWWAQHNEHRIVLARLLFWLDYTFFKGTSLFLIISNYLLLSCISFVFWKLLFQSLNVEDFQAHRTTLALLITSWLFSWSQENNLTWAFQSQFLLAQLVPLCALYWMSKSLREPGVNRDFLISAFFGIASIGTMANGVIILPLMTLYAVLVRQHITRIAILGLLSISTITIYFHGYQSPGGHGSLSQAISQDPVALIHYLLLYLGSPFYYIFGSSELGKAVAIVAGAAFVGISINYAAKSIFDPANNKLVLLILVFVLYIGGTALGTAGGRAMFGPDQALSSRYATPALMGWASLFILMAPTLLARPLRLIPKITIIITAALLASAQLKALNPFDQTLFQRQMAALSLELQVHDSKQIKQSFPFVDMALSIASRASEKDLGIFGQPPLLNAKEQIGQFPDNGLETTCIGSIDGIASINDEAIFLSIRGWIYNEAENNSPKVIRVLDSENRLVGFGLTGEARGDVAKAVNQNALFSGYRGYILKSSLEEPLTLLGDESCSLKRTPPELFFTYKETPPSPNLTEISESNVEPDNSWLGKDFHNTQVDKLRIYGSFIQSDTDMGSISLKIKRGDQLFYRSGPTNGGQFVSIDSASLGPSALPLATDWVLLNFEHKTLTKDFFTVTLTDNGKNWGEWSAIAVLQKNPATH